MSADPVTGQRIPDRTTVSQSSPSLKSSRFRSSPAGGTVTTTTKVVGTEPWHTPAVTILAPGGDEGKLDELRGRGVLARHASPSEGAAIAAAKQLILDGNTGTAPTRGRNARGMPRAAPGDEAGNETVARTLNTLSLSAGAAAPLRPSATSSSRAPATLGSTLPAAVTVGGPREGAEGTYTLPRGYASAPLPPYTQQQGTYPEFEDGVPPPMTAAELSAAPAAVQEGMRARLRAQAHAAERKRKESFSSAGGKGNVFPVGASSRLPSDPFMAASPAQARGTWGGTYAADVADSPFSAGPRESVVTAKNAQPMSQSQGGPPQGTVGGNVSRAGGSGRGHEWSSMNVTDSNVSGANVRGRDRHPRPLPHTTITTTPAGTGGGGARAFIPPATTAAINSANAAAAAAAHEALAGGATASDAADAAALAAALQASQQRRPGTIVATSTATVMTPSRGGKPGQPVSATVSTVTEPFRPEKDDATLSPRAPSLGGDDLNRSVYLSKGKKSSEQATDAVANERAVGAVGTGVGTDRGTYGISQAPHRDNAGSYVPPYTITNTRGEVIPANFGPGLGFDAARAATLAAAAATAEESRWRHRQDMRPGGRYDDAHGYGGWIPAEQRPATTRWGQPGGVFAGNMTGGSSSHQGGQGRLPPPGSGGGSIWDETWGLHGVSAQQQQQGQQQWDLDHQGAARVRQRIDEMLPLQQNHSFSPYSQPAGQQHVRTPTLQEQQQQERSHDEQSGKQKKKGWWPFSRKAETPTATNNEQQRLDGSQNGGVLSYLNDQADNEDEDTLAPPSHAHAAELAAAANGLTFGRAHGDGGRSWESLAPSQRAQLEHEWSQARARAQARLASLDYGHDDGTATRRHNAFSGAYFANPAAEAARAAQLRGSSYHMSEDAANKATAQLNNKKLSPEEDNSRLLAIARSAAENPSSAPRWLWGLDSHEVASLNHHQLRALEAGARAAEPVIVHVPGVPWPVDIKSIDDPATSPRGVPFSLDQHIRVSRAAMGAEEAGYALAEDLSNDTSLVLERLTAARTRGLAAEQASIARARAQPHPPGNGTPSRSDFGDLIVRRGTPGATRQLAIAQSHQDIETALQAIRRAAVDAYGGDEPPMETIGVLDKPVRSIKVRDLAAILEELPQGSVPEVVELTRMLRYDALPAADWAVVARDRTARAFGEKEDEGRLGREAGETTMENYAAANKLRRMAASTYAEETATPPRSSSSSSTRRARSSSPSGSSQEWRERMRAEYNQHQQEWLQKEQQLRQQWQQEQQQQQGQWRDESDLRRSLYSANTGTRYSTSSGDRTSGGGMTREQERREEQQWVDGAPIDIEVRGSRNGGSGAPQGQGWETAERARALDALGYHRGSASGKTVTETVIGGPTPESRARAAKEDHERRLKDRELAAEAEAKYGTAPILSHLQRGSGGEWAEPDQPLTSTLTSAAGAVAGAAKRAVGNAASDAASEVKSAAKGVANDAAEAVKGAGQSIKHAAESAVDALTPRSKGVLGEAADAVKDALTPRSKGVVGEVVDAAKSASKNVSKGLRHAAEDVKDAATGAVAGALGAAKDTVADATHAVKDAASDVARSAKNAAAGALDDAKHAAADVVDDVKDAAKGAAHKAKDAVADAADGASTGVIGKIGGAIQDAAEAVVDKVTDAVGYSSSSQKGVFSEAVSKAADSAAKAVGLKEKTTAETITDTVSGAVESGKGALSSLSDAASDAAAAVSKKGVVGAAKDAVASAADAALNKVDDVVSDVAMGATGRRALREIKSTASDVASSLASAAQATPEGREAAAAVGRVADAAADAAGAVGSALSGAKGAAQDAVSDAAGAVAGAVKSAAGSAGAELKARGEQALKQAATTAIAAGAEAVKAGAGVSEGLAAAAREGGAVLKDAASDAATVAAKAVDGVGSEATAAAAAALGGGARSRSRSESRGAVAWGEGQNPPSGEQQRHEKKGVLKRLREMLPFGGGDRSKSASPSPRSSSDPSATAFNRALAETERSSTHAGTFVTSLPVPSAIEKCFDGQGRELPPTAAGQAQAVLAREGVYLSVPSGGWVLHPHEKMASSAFSVAREVQEQERQRRAGNAAANAGETVMEPSQAAEEKAGLYVDNRRAPGQHAYVASNKEAVGTKAFAAAAGRSTHEDDEELVRRDRMSNAGYTAAMRNGSIHNDGFGDVYQDALRQHKRYSFNTINATPPPSGGPLIAAGITPGDGSGTASGVGSSAGGGKTLFHPGSAARASMGSNPFAVKKAALTDSPPEKPPGPIRRFFDRLRGRSPSPARTTTLTQGQRDQKWAGEKSFLTAPIASAAGTAAGIAGTLTRAADDAAASVKDAAESLKDSASSAVHETAETFTSALRDGRSDGRAAVSRAEHAVKDTLRDGARGAEAAVKDTIERGAHSLVSGAERATDKISDSVDAAARAVGGAVGSAVGGAGRALNDAAHGLERGVGEVKHAAEDVAHGVKSAAEDVAHGAANVAKRGVTALAEGAGTAAGAVAGAAGEAASGLARGVQKGAEAIESATRSTPMSVVTGGRYYNVPGSASPAAAADWQQAHVQEQQRQQQQLDQFHSHQQQLQASAVGHSGVAAAQLANAAQTPAPQPRRDGGMPQQGAREAVAQGVATGGPGEHPAARNAVAAAATLTGERSAAESDHQYAHRQQQQGQLREHQQQQQREKQKEQPQQPQWYERLGGTQARSLSQQQGQGYLYQQQQQQGQHSYAHPRLQELEAAYQRSLHTSPGAPPLDMQLQQQRQQQYSPPSHGSNTASASQRGLWAGGVNAPYPLAPSLQRDLTHQESLNAAATAYSPNTTLPASAAGAARLSAGSSPQSAAAAAAAEAAVTRRAEAIHTGGPGAGVRNSAARSSISTGAVPSRTRNDPGNVDGFAQELQMLQSLPHPHANMPITLSQQEMALCTRAALAVPPATAAEADFRRWLVADRGWKTDSAGRVTPPSGAFDTPERQERREHWFEDLIAATATGFDFEPDAVHATAGKGGEADFAAAKQGRHGVQEAALRDYPSIAGEIKERLPRTAPLEADEHKDSVDGARWQRAGAAHGAVGDAAWDWRRTVAGAPIPVGPASPYNHQQQQQQQWLWQQQQQQQQGAPSSATSSLMGDHNSDITERELWLRDTADRMSTHSSETESHYSYGGHKHLGDSIPHYDEQNLTRSPPMSVRSDAPQAFWR